MQAWTGWRGGATQSPVGYITHSRPVAWMRACRSGLTSAPLLVPCFVLHRSSCHSSEFMSPLRRRRPPHIHKYSLRDVERCHPDTCYCCALRALFLPLRVPGEAVIPPEDPLAIMHISTLLLAPEYSNRRFFTRGSSCVCVRGICARARVCVCVMTAHVFTQSNQPYLHLRRAPLGS